MWLSKKRLINHLYISIRFLSIKRVINFLLLTCSFCIAKVLKKDVIKGLPWTASIEPSGNCNLKCPGCPIGVHSQNSTKSISITLYKKIVSQLSPSLFYINFWFQGEPLINKETPNLIAYASKRRIYTNLSTNGHFLNREMCKRLIDSDLTNIIISIDGFTKKTYNSYRIGGDLDKVKKGVKRVIDFRNEKKSSTPFVTIQFLMFKHNESEAEDIIKWSKSIGADKVVLKSAQLYTFTDNNIQPPENKKYSRYIEKNNGEWIMKGKLKNYCAKQWGSIVFNSRGVAALCCYDKALKYSPGNITTTSFKDIWFGKKLSQYRETILKDKKRISICNNCPEQRMKTEV
ncbi:radical SAM protein [Marinilabiliaceae bacterium ANBcel2]|nr:radical SAM protein [Marinilabiliaceae bacterium ANBcel2]